MSSDILCPQERGRGTRNSTAVCRQRGMKVKGNWGITNKEIEEEWKEMEGSGKRAIESKNFLILNYFILKTFNGSSKYCFPT